MTTYNAISAPSIRMISCLLVSICSAFVTLPTSSFSISCSGSMIACTTGRSIDTPTVSSRPPIRISSARPAICLFCFLSKR